MRLADDTERHMIYGQTGSGKTVAGLWALEKRSWDRKPWIILDFKRDKTIKRIPRLEELDVRARPTKHTGLYVVRPRVNERHLVTEFMWRMWEQENIGLMVDEGYMVPKMDPAWMALLTQGRSKHIPIINLSQRPCWLAPWVMPEATFHQVFHLTNPADMDRVEEYFPGFERTRRDFTSQYYDTITGEITKLKPVPPEEVILERFDSKMPRRVRHFRGLFENAGASAGRKARY